MFRGEVWRVDFDPSLGGEIQKTTTDRNPRCSDPPRPFLHRRQLRASGRFSLYLTANLAHPANRPRDPSLGTSELVIPISEAAHEAARFHPYERLRAQARGDHPEVQSMDLGEPSGPQHVQPRSSRDSRRLQSFVLRGGLNRIRSDAACGLGSTICVWNPHRRIVRARLFPRRTAGQQGAQRPVPAINRTTLGEFALVDRMAMREQARFRFRGLRPLAQFSGQRLNSLEI